MTLEDIYNSLLAHYGLQGWWPIQAYNGSPANKTGARRGYHPGDYSFPRNATEGFEVAVGAILTQNTAWTNVESALSRLLAAADTPEAMLALPENTLRRIIRPTGYFNTKTRKLREYARFHDRLQGRTPSRKELLDVWGVGPETADCIRLYAYGLPEMVIDAYTRRILANLKLVDSQAAYGELKQFCVANLPAAVPVYQEFHALMVEHGKHCPSHIPFRDPLLG